MNKEVSILQLSYGNYVSLNDYVKLQQENQQLKKQKDDVVEYIKNNFIEGEVFYSKSWLKMKKDDLLRMLGEIDDR